MGTTTHKKHCCDELEYIKLSPASWTETWIQMQSTSSWESRVFLDKSFSWRKGRGRDSWSNWGTTENFPQFCQVLTPETKSYNVIARWPSGTTWATMGSTLLRSRSRSEHTNKTPARSGHVDRAGEIFTWACYQVGSGEYTSPLRPVIIRGLSHHWNYSGENCS